jgi:hypothetical protein
MNWRGPSETPRVDVAIYKGFNPVPSPSTSSYLSPSPSPTTSSSSSTTFKASATPTISTSSITSSSKAPAVSTLSITTSKYTAEYTQTTSASKVATTLSTVKVTSSFTTARSSSSTASVPAPTWTSLGCYTDSVKSRGLPVGVPVTSGMTVGRCVDACQKKGYSYAAVEYSTECFCGSAINSPSVKAKEAECNMKCSGDSSQTCGGGNRMNVYAKGPLTSNTMVRCHFAPKWTEVTNYSAALHLPAGRLERYLPEYRGQALEPMLQFQGSPLVRLH